MSIKNRTKFLGEKLTEKGKPYYSLTRYPEIPLNINDIYVTTISGDRLDLLANQFYNDIRLWWVIASANRDVVKGDSWSLKGGLELRIPARSDFILDNFKEINQKNRNNI